jgi:Ni/Co efflux regulator RcnB
MTAALSTMFKRIGLATGAGLIAISASTFVTPVTMAAAPGTNAGQVPADQLPLTKDQKKASGNGQSQNGQSQNGQSQNGQSQNGKPQNLQGQSQLPPLKPATNGQAQYQPQGGQQNGKPTYQNNGQPQNGQQWGQQNGQSTYQNNGQPQNGQQWGQQNGQSTYQNNGQPKNGQQWGQQNGQSHPQNPHYDWTSYRPGHQPAQWQQHQQGFNPRAYEINGDSRYRYHWQHYVQPRGWYYRRWVYGQTLPMAFWGREYWLDGYANFGLIDPPYGYVWVRYGNDAMLLAVESGLILSVQYGVFFS